MVARTPPKVRKMVAVAPLNPILIRETLMKVDKCMARLQELQYTVTGGRKKMGMSEVSLSPRSIRGYLKTSLRIKNNGSKKSPVGKLPVAAIGEWRRMSLPAMLVGETVGEILQASQFAREIVAAAACKASKSTLEDPKTPVSQHRKKHRVHPEDTELKSKRKKEKQHKLQSIRSETGSPSLQRARSRINFKVSPPKKRVVEKENPVYVANRVSPRNRPWARKTVLFPNPLFLATDSAEQKKFCKTRSPVIGRTKQAATPHKFLIKSPPSASKFQVKIRAPPVVSLSPTRLANLSKKPTKVSTASKLRRSFSPSRLANRLVSPLKSRKSVQRNDGLMSGLKQRAVAPSPRRFSLGRI